MGFPFFRFRILQKPTIYRLQKLKFCDVSRRVIAGCENGLNERNPDGKTIQEADTICRLVSTIGNSRDLDAVLNSGNLSDSLPPNLVLEVLKKLSNSGTMALSFFRWAERKRSFEHTPECYNTLIESLGKIRQFKSVWSLVDEMKLKGILCKDTFAIVSRRLARARKVREAIEAFEKMEKKYGMKIELQDYNRLLDTLCKSGLVERAHQVFDKWKNRRFTPNIISYTILMEGWGQECNFLKLDEVYREMEEDGFEPDVVIYGILIKAYCKAKNHDQAIKLYHEMERKHIEATPHIYSTLINGLGQEKRLNEAIKFFELFKSSSCCCVIEIPNYNALVGAYCWSARIHDAYKVVDEMRKLGLGPNTRTYNIILNHLVKLQRTEEVHRVFQRMNEEAGCKPAVSTYEIMVRMFCNMGRTDMAIRMWDQMKSRGMLPRMHMFSGLINCLCDGDKLDVACRYFQEMLDMGIRPPERLFKNLKQCLLKDGKEDIINFFALRIEKLRKSPVVAQRECLTEEL